LYQPRQVKENGASSGVEIVVRNNFFFGEQTGAMVQRAWLNFEFPVW
jgi:hypothetical protein